MQDVFPDVVKRAPGAQGIQTGRAVTLRDVLLLLRRRRLLIVTVTLLGTAATTLLALARWATPRWWPTGRTTTCSDCGAPPGRGHAFDCWARQG